MERYDHWIGKVFKFVFASSKDGYYGVTLGQTTYYSCPEADVTARSHRHEDKHKEQWRRDGCVKFLIRYVWQYFTKGYANIDYEIEARKAEHG